MAISNSRLQQLLAQTAWFQQRVQSQLLAQAAVVLVETGIGATHAARAAYAKAVFSGNGVQAAANYLAGSTNVSGTITFEDEGPRTSVTDASLLSQIATDWNKLAGIDSGN